jgi:hypothetical protein
MIVVSMIFSSFSVFAEGEKNDGVEWVGVDGGSLNYDTSNYAQQAKIVVYKNEMYVIWQERNGSSIDQIRVKKYDGSKWFGVDNGYLNYDSSKEAFFPDSVVYNNELYVTWQEKKGSHYQIRAKKYDGSKWVGVDNGYLNYDSSKEAFSPNSVVYNNELYVIW